MPNNTITQRQDANGYFEGLTYGQAIMIELAKLLWLQPGITYTQHVLDQAGQVQIPVVKRGDLAGATNLCDEANLNKALKEFKTLLLDKKISGEFGGCFVTSNMVPENWKTLLDDATLMQMAIDYIVTINAGVEAGATATTVDATGLTAWDYLNQAKVEHFNRTKRFPTFALISVDFQAKLANERTQLGTAGSDFTYVNGTIGTAAGMNLILAEIDVPFILGTSDAIHIANPSTLDQVPGLNTATSLDTGFSGGLVSNVIIRDGFMQRVTQVHKPFGFTTVPTLLTKGVPIV